MFDNALYKKIGRGLLTGCCLALLANLGGCGFGEDFDSPYVDPTPTPEPTPGPDPTPTPEPTPPPANLWLGETVLMENTGLETSDTEVSPWMPQGPSTLAVSTDVAYRGSNSLLISDRTANWQGGAYPLLGELESNTEYVFFAYVRMASPASGPVGMTVKTTDNGADSYTGVVTVEDVSDGGWTEMRGTFTTGDLTNVTEQIVYFESTDETASYYVDDFAVRLPADLDVPNGNLEAEENTTDPWSPQGPSTLTLETSIVNTGNNSLLISDRTDSWNGGGYELVNILEPNTDYLLSAYVRLASTDVTTISMTVKTTDGGTDSYSGLATVDGLDSGWSQIRGFFSTGDTTNVSTQFVYFESASETASYYVDDLLVQLSPAVEAPNGDLETDESDYSPWFAQSATLAINGADGFAHSGSRSLLISGRDQNWQGGAYPILSQVKDNTRYQISAFVRMEAPSAADITLTAKTVETGQSDAYTSIATVNAIDTGWVEITGAFETGDLTEVTDLFVYLESPDPTASYYVDTLTIELR